MTPSQKNEEILREEAMPNDEGTLKVGAKDEGTLTVGPCPRMRGP